ncbi:MAG: hypothetical protein MUE51_07725 [Thermoleophilia bacterium]|nr:hypothetical protein [Thermoleophilia bacterium]
MRGFGSRVIVALAVNAVALILMGVLFDRAEVSWAWFPLLLVVFTAVSLIVYPLVRAVVRDKAPTAAFLVGLIAAWIALLITEIVSDSIQIEGILTWVLCTLIVWLAFIVTSVVAGAQADRRAKAGATRA